MKKNDKAKLDLFLTGLKARIVQNSDYFLSLTMDFKSGAKVYTATCAYEGSVFQLGYRGEKKTVDINGLGDFFAMEAESYEESQLIYRERGGQSLLSVTARGVLFKQSEEPISEEDMGNTGTREYIIPPSRAKALLTAIGILTKDGKLKNDMIRKYSQIDHYVELVAPMLAACDDEEILLLDCACGKSYLSFVLNFYLRDILKKKCKIIGIDISEGVIEKSRGLAAELGYANMEFITADLKTYVPPKNVTAVISLHACDIATDLALATAIHAKAKCIACVPCCHKELLEQFAIEPLAPLFKQGIFKARMNDLLTDSLRALRLEAEGYLVSALEYISPLDTPKNLLIRAQRKGGRNEKMMAEYRALTAYLGTKSTLDLVCDSGHTKTL